MIYSFTNTNFTPKITLGQNAGSFVCSEERHQKRLIPVGLKAITTHLSVAEDRSHRLENSGQIEILEDGAMTPYPARVVIEEQGLRDGLQSEKTRVPTAKKLKIIDALVDAGMRRIQVTSFVNPSLIPQMADAEALCAGLNQRPGVIYSALVLNARGIERAAKAGLKHVSASISASDTHSRKNANVSLVEARRQLADMIKIGKAHGLTISGGMQCVFGCRFEGAID
jgi:uncharacterized protein (DUF1501 family)